MKTRHLPRFSIPSSIQERIRWGLEQEGFSIDQPGPLAKAILDLSRRYCEQNADTQMWADKRIRAAYWSYYLPLNFMRLRAVIEDGLTLGFFSNVTSVVDFGCGPGTGLLACLQTPFAQQIKQYHSLDASSHALKMLSSMCGRFPTPFSHDSRQSVSLIEPPSEMSLALFSYSLNEIQSLSETLGKYSHVLIVEPSTREQGRHLMKWRKDLMKLGYHVWAPCTHQLACPLLENSATDWCHDRILIERPEWLVKIEAQLPLDNQSLTFSYLLASRIPPTDNLGVRVIGDTQREKGKDRQAICRNDQREFFSWLRKEGRPPLLPRGTRVQIATDSPIKGNEVRPGRDITWLSAHGGLEYFEKFKK